MNILRRYRRILTILVIFLVCSECFPSKHKKTGKHRLTVNSHSKGHVHGKSTKKDSVRPSNQDVMAAVMHPGKLDTREEKELSQLQDFNKEFINNEMAAETSLLANQGIDDDSALRISNIEALPNADTSSKTKISDMKDETMTTSSKQNVAAYSPDEYFLDSNSWPEYKIKDSDYMNRNFRVYPQGQNEEEGGFQGGMMPYGARGRTEAAAEMEGPYGDGNYGFPQPPQMVSDQQPADSNAQPPNEGSQITKMPMNKVNKVQRLIMKSHKIKNPANEKFNDANTISSGDSSNKGALHSAEGNSESGAGSGHSDPNLKEHKAPMDLKETGDSPKASSVNSNEKVGGDDKGTGVAGTGADMGEKGSGAAGGRGGETTEGTGLLGAGKAGPEGNGAEGKEADSNKGMRGPLSSKSNSDTSQPLTSQAKPELAAINTKPTLIQKQTADKTQNLSLNVKDASSPEKTESNATNGSSDKTSSNPSSGPSAKEITNALSQAKGNSPLGEFAEFLKSKGITLTINKDENSNSNSNDAQTAFPQQDQPSSAATPNAPAESMLASVLPSTGVSTSNTNEPTKTNDSQGNQAANLNNAVMNWQNVAPQSGQLGELFLRKSNTKQGHH